MSSFNFYLYAFYSLVGLSLAHDVITDNLIRPSTYNWVKYMPFTASLGLSLAHSSF